MATRDNNNKHRSVSFQDDHANDDDDDVESSFNTGTIASSIDAHVQDQNLLSAKEDRWVCGLRVLTCVLLLGVAVIVCLVVYLTQRESEREQYQQEFDNLADKLRSSFESSVQQRFQVLAAFADSLTAESLALAEANDGSNGTAMNSTTAGTWPFFTPHDFSDRFERVAQLAQVMAVHMLWKVEGHQLKEWNRYSVENSAWRPQGISKQRNIPLEQVLANNVTDYLPYIYDPYTNPGENIPVELSTRPQGPYWPIWMSYPVSDYAIANLDLYHDWEHIYPINKTQLTGKTVLEYTYDYKGHIEKEGDIRYDFISENKFIDYQDDPHASALIPVFDRFDDDSKRVVAQLFVYIYWRQYFDGLLPPGADGIIVVLSNSCDQVYTYQIDGSKSRWLGRGDLHDPRYDHVNVSTSINQILLAGGNNNNNNNTQEEEFADDTESDILYYDCFYNIKVYPSQEFENSYYTSRPWVQATILAALFLFTSTVFISYDRLVERRQQLVLKAAIEARKEIRKQELKDEFLAIMAHEIRTPLHQVTGFVDLLDQTSLDVEQKSFVGVLKTSVQGLMTVINDVLDYSKLEAGHMKLENIPYEPLAVTRGSMEAVRKGCDERGLYLHLDWDTRIPFKLKNDPNRLRQILLNLLSNSVKFTKKGGITVKATYLSNESDQSDRTSVTVNSVNGDDTTTRVDDDTKNTTQEQRQHQQQQPMIKFVISDTGIGISEQHRKVIFKKYQQANATIARNYGGTGLGLSICHSLVSMMGGSMGVDSTLGKGTNFWFLLPAVTPTEKDLAGEDMLDDEEMASLLSPVVVPSDPSWSNGDVDASNEVPQRNDTAREEQQPSLQSAVAASNDIQGANVSRSSPVQSNHIAAAKAENNGLNVLLVEDNKVNQKLMLNMLRRLGHTASVAENGKEAIDIIAAGEPDEFDVCLMDIQMPVCDGYEATKRLRSMGYTELPIYGLTASMGRSDFAEIGFNDWLPKPIRMKDLKMKLYQLWKLLQQKRQHQQQERQASISSELLD